MRIRAFSSQRPKSRLLGPRPPSSPTRQLGRLVLALVLVILCMQRASDPSLYRRLFQRMGWSEAPTQQLSAIAIVNTKKSNALTPEKAPVLSTDAAKQLTVNMSREQVRRLTRWMLDAGVVPTTMNSDSPKDEPEQEPESLSVKDENQVKDEGFDDRVTQALALVSDLIASWQLIPEAVVPRELVSILERLATKQKLSSEDSWELEPLRAGLDARVVEEAEDPVLLGARPMPGEEWLAIRAAALRSEEGYQPKGAEVGALPLLQQPAVYRGQWCRVRGKIAQTESIRLTHGNSLYRLWIQPYDGSQRPVAFSCYRLPEFTKNPASEGSESLDNSTASEAKTASNAENFHRLQGSDVIVSGWYLTRVTYPAKVGLNTAPYLVGHAELLSPLTELSETAATSPMSERRFGYLILFVLVTTVAGTCGFYLWSLRTQRKQRHFAQGLERHSAERFLKELEE